MVSKPSLLPSSPAHLSLTIPTPGPQIHAPSRKTSPHPHLLPHLRRSAQHQRPRKALPSVASINGMQVKDYLQALSDENKIRVEKIGSGNWYWSFASEEKAAKEAVLEKVKEERERAGKAVEELKRKVEDAQREREEDGDMLMGEGEGREELQKKWGVEGELAGYNENDPVEVERKRHRIAECGREAEKWTEQIQSMEGWFKDQVGGDREQLTGLKRNFYGDEFDEEEQGLKEL
ncbi:hypothetical protein H2199_003283 [Coniosporium tulheliwenetii]|uniref:Uncharacterized protein n=1 Tax=Coniosporium tulheliwenetii TaxID=3383036 RepID=A0ACC2ZBV6_9PEZI|nr:hypothetical protein H2199_003283 [Cladosporium sp. JES 115]